MHGNGSNSLTFSRPVDSDPMANNFGPTGGTGLKDMRQQVITFDIKFDDRLANAKLREATNPNVLFQSTNPKCQDILKGEPVYIKKKKPGQDADILGVTTGLSNFNNELAIAAILYPNSWRMQQECIFNDIVMGGLAISDVSYESKNYAQGLALQNKGTETVLAKVNMPAGYEGMWAISSPSDNRHNFVGRNVYAPREKVVAHIAPYSPDTIAHRVKTIQESYFMDAQKFEKAMGKDIRTTNGWINFCKTRQESTLSNFLLILDLLIKFKIIKAEFVAPVDATNSFDFSTGMALSNDSLILGMAKAFGLLPNTASDIPGVNINGNTTKLYSELSEQIMMTIFCPEQVANFQYGWDDDEGRNMAINPENNAISTHTSQGAMLYRQLNGPREEVCALAFATQRDNDRKACFIASSGMIQQNSTVVFN